MYNTPQKLSAEFLGTFALVFFGEGAACALQSIHESGGGFVLFAVALAHGLALATMIYALGHISGGHFNPAVTIGYWVTKRQNTIDTLSYWAAQLGGAVVAAFLLKVILPIDAWRDIAGGTPDALRDFPRLSAMILEAVATFFMVLVIFATTRRSDTDDDSDSPRSLAGFAVGLVYFLGILIAGPFSGGALNPARAFGSALASTHWHVHGVYWVGPLAGGFLAGLLFDSLFLRKSV